MAYASWSVVFGEQPSATKWNILGTNDAHFYSFLGDNLAWQTYSPTLTNISGGTTTYAKYLQVGKTVFVRFRYVLAGAGIGTGPQISLPVAPATNYVDGDPLMADARLIDTGTDTCPARVSIDQTNDRIFINREQTSSVDSTLQSITSTTPFTWANTDVISVAFIYEAA